MKRLSERKLHVLPVWSLLVFAVPASLPLEIPFNVRVVTIYIDTVNTPFFGGCIRWSSGTYMKRGAELVGNPGGGIHSVSVVVFAALAETTLVIQASVTRLIRLPCTLMSRPTKSVGSVLVRTQ